MLSGEDLMLLAGDTKNIAPGTEGKQTRARGKDSATVSGQVVVLDCGKLA